MYITVAGSLHSVNPAEFWGAVPGISDVSIYSEARTRTPGSTPSAHIFRLSGCNADTIATWSTFRRTVNGPVIAWLPSGTTADAFHLFRAGADGLVTDDSTIEERFAAVQGVTKSEEITGAPLQFRGMVGESDGMKILREVIQLVSPRKCTVLITGETGVGKEVVARAIHEASPRSAQRMVSINCSAIPSELLEAELFGSVKGAYTGAHANRTGRFEQANKGTLFLDEIGDLPLPLQAKLLRVLQEREFERLGSSTSVQVDVRVIAATHANLLDLVQRGKFRQDLYYRLNVAPIEILPLRERRDDIPELVNWFVGKVCSAEEIPLKSVPAEVVQWLAGLPWLGNVRELENAVESAIALSGMRPVLRMGDFQSVTGNSFRQPRLFALPESGVNFNRVVGQFERTLLTEALRISGGSKKAAAELLQLKRTTLLCKLAALGIGSEEPAADEDVIDQETAA